MELIKITALSKDLNISSRSLRYYEQAGLIKSIRQQFDKYRYYDNKNIERIKQIMVLRKMNISVKDIMRIYNSKDMSTVVEVFVDKINKIENEITALSELKLLVNEFLTTMQKSGIKKISAIPLLYDEMEKQLKQYDMKKKPIVEQLSNVMRARNEAVDMHIVTLPALRMLTSINIMTGQSDTSEFWNWLTKNNINMNRQGQQRMFEYQKTSGETVIMMEINKDYENNSVYVEEDFEGGLFAVGSVYTDEDIMDFHQRMIESFDESPFYQVDYNHDNSLRHESLVETVISPDSKREKVLIYIPVKKRMPNSGLYDPNEIIDQISVDEILEANPILWHEEVPLDGLIPINKPYYRINEQGEAEYISYISTRLLSTNVKVKLPFRVDIEFKVDSKSGRFGYGSDEGSIIFYHGDNQYGINRHNNSDSQLSEEAIVFNQPIFNDYYKYAKRGKINYDVYNKLTWIIGEKHFAVIINNEVRYCGKNFLYMRNDLSTETPLPIILGSDGQGKRYFRKITVSQLKLSPKLKINKGEFNHYKKQSNNIIGNIHKLVTSEYGENYWFNGCAKYVMECKNEPDYDYWFFAGLTGDLMTQIYSYDGFLGDCASNYMLINGANGQFIKEVFAKCGYESEFVSQTKIIENPKAYIRTIIKYIDKGIPVIFNSKAMPSWNVFVGYEEDGETLLYMTGDKEQPSRTTLNECFPEHTAIEEKDLFGLCFVDDKVEDKELGQLYRQAISDLPKLLTFKSHKFCFGGNAFRAWADSIERGDFDQLNSEDFDGWGMYTVYICNLATNGSCANKFIDKALKLNPELTFLKEVKQHYIKMKYIWNNPMGNNLETLGGGFNITLSTLQDKEKAAKIVGKLRELGELADQVVEIIDDNLDI